MSSLTHEETCNLDFETQFANPGIPWNYLHGMRNRFAHDYGSVDPAITWETVQNCSRVGQIAGVAPIKRDRPLWFAAQGLQNPGAAAREPKRSVPIDWPDGQPVNGLFWFRSQPAAAVR